MTKRLTTQEFIYKATIVHGDKYDYSLVNYTNGYGVIKIICNNHGGIFEQAAYSHLAGHGCLKCSGKEKSTTLEFVNKAKLIHGNKYDYSFVKYVGRDIKVKILCIKHNKIFNKSPRNHLHGQGCPICSHRKKHDKISFIKAAKIIHGNKYSYSDVEYINFTSKVKIKCKIHNNFFEQKPAFHLQGGGCPRCGGTGKYTTEEFIEKSSIIHNYKYDYSKANYKGSQSKIIIICPIHGQFKQMATSHLNGHGCAQCSNFISKAETQWLDTLNIDKKYRQKIIKIDSKTWFKVDAFVPETNTIYEFYGNFWHGNPKIYKPRSKNKVNKKTFGFLYKKTLQKEKILKDHGYNLVIIWESDFINTI